MIVRHRGINSLFSSSASSSIAQIARPAQCIRSLHRSVAPAPIPSPTPFVPDPQTFLTLIGRNLSKHASKIPSWEALFTLTSSQLNDLGIAPPRDRKYLLRWREKFRKGQFGVGGDLQEVVDGTAYLRAVEVPISKPGQPIKNKVATATRSPGTVKMVVNVSAPDQAPKGTIADLKRVEQVKLRGAHTIKGPHVLPVKGTRGKVASIKVAEGLWEHKRGHKIDGGERRRAEVRAKRAAAERKAARV
ncbi:MAG: hypothetical protein M1819_002295 [Sarea resinae]|nr:MAG: hypothetical protein M1819_002295 [Sarea resinae]